MEQLGTITADGETRSVRFERRLAHPAEAVWAALTEAERLAEWLAEAVVEPGEGGSVTLDFGEGGKETGQITLTLEHTLLEAESAPGYGAGWHAHLDQLVGHLDGEIPDWDERFAALQPRYEELAARA